jgi:ribonuclease-3
MPGRGASRAARPGSQGLVALRRKLGVKLHNPNHLVQALTHTSYAHEHPDEGAVDNERLEFLGDAVLELVAAEVLYRRNPDAGEGSLTLDRAAVVSTGALAAAARRIDLGRYLRVGKGVEKTGGRDLDSLLANSLEAVIGAIYLDLGFEAAAGVFARLGGTPEDGAINHKGRLQELTQADAEGVPVYAVVEAIGPAHRRRYRVEVRIAGVRLGAGEGSTRRAAEQAAAKAAIGKFEATRTGIGDEPVRRGRDRRSRLTGEGRDRRSGLTGEAEIGEVG